MMPFPKEIKTNHLLLKAPVSCRKCGINVDNATLTTAGKTCRLMGEVLGTSISIDSGERVL
jgi:hypothetical protein